MKPPPERGPAVELQPPLSSVAWSGDFVAQTIEALFVYLAADEARYLRPVHAESLRLGWGPGQQPGQIVLDAAARYGVAPLVAHSTSWRHEPDRVVLTYVVAVAPPAGDLPYLADEPVTRSDLARGDAFGPPPAIGVGQVIEHAFRHLAWLVADDAVVGAALADWATFLARYEPEPFRAFGPTTG
jgi:hypothetical protein